MLTCHSNFNVSIEAGNWSLIAVEGYELERGNYGFNDGNDSMCVSRTPYADLHFDIQDHCHGGRKTMKVRIPRGDDESKSYLIIINYY